jgi:hypothetical protein
MNNVNGYPLEAVIGMAAVGIFCTLIGTLVSFTTLFKGEIKTFSAYGKNYTYKLKDIKPLKFWYFCALVETLILGPIIFLLGIVGLFTFLNVYI